MQAQKLKVGRVKPRSNISKLTVCIERILTVLFFVSALMSKEFIHLHKSDQRKLLARNVPLYVQYVLARYINSDSGYEQISWLLGRVCEKMRFEES